MNLFTWIRLKLLLVKKFLKSSGHEPEHPIDWAELYNKYSLSRRFIMRTRERLLFIALGGLLALAGMILGQFVSGPVQAQDETQDATFKTVRRESDY